MNLKYFNCVNNMRWKRYKCIPCVCLIVYLYYFFGIGDYIYSKKYEEFDYPLNLDIKPLVQEVLAGKKSSVNPVNYYPYRFISNSGKCNTIEKLDLFIVVKSAMANFGHRAAIRQTYGQENFIAGRIIKTLFFLGIDDHPKGETQMKIEQEMAQFKDIIQIDFKDAYFNNTIKTMMSFRWVYEHCSTADYYLFTDDDMYISVGNLLDYVNDQQTSERTLVIRDYLSVTKKPGDGHLFAGYLFKSTPQRFWISKWRVSLHEYPWDKWPPYITAGAYVVSNKSMKHLYVGSLFVKHFRFDDIYVAIVAKKVGIVPRHCGNFHFYKKKYSKEGYRDVIASHGFSDHDELVRVWNEQNNHG